MVGSIASVGFYSRIYPAFINMHPDLVSTSFTMNSRTPGTYDFVSEVGVNIGSIVTDSTSISLVSFVNQSISFQYSTVDSFGVQFNVDSESYLSLLENAYIEILPIVSWSAQSSTSITYLISDFNGITAPNWIAIDFSSGLLKILTPNVTSSLEVSFYLNSQISGISSLYQKIIYLKINKWLIQNWDKCSIKDTTKCEIWKNSISNKEGTHLGEKSDSTKIINLISNWVILWVALP